MKSTNMMPLMLVPVSLLLVGITLCRSPLLALSHSVYERLLKLLRGKVCVRKTHAYVFNKCTHGQAETVLSTFNLYAEAHRSLSIGPEKGEFLDEVVRRKAPLRVLELGMHCGYSSVRILRLLPPSGKLLTVEIDTLTAEKGEEIILVAGFKHKHFQVLNCSSAKAISGIVSHLGADHLDLVVMDHDPDQYLTDLQALQNEKLLSECSVLVLNGSQEPGAQAVLKYISARPKNYRVNSHLKDMLEICCYTDPHPHEQS